MSKTRQNDHYGGSRLTDVAPDFEAFTAHGMLKFPFEQALMTCGVAAVKLLGKRL